MSNFIPFEIQVEILKRLPTKSLLRFRGVCKLWKSVISSSDFIASYRGPGDRQQPMVMIRYMNARDSFDRYIALTDDETIGHQRISPFQLDFNEVNCLSTIVATSDGLFCFYGFYKSPSSPRLLKEAAVIWNPSIRRSVVVAVPNVLQWPFEIVLGFGVCPITRDPKIVKIAYIVSSREMGGITTIPSQVEVFSLSSGTWKNPFNNGSDAYRPRTSIEFTSSQVALGRVIHWLAYDRVLIMNGVFLLMTFDMVSESFREINLPERLALPCGLSLSLTKLGESIAFIEYDIVAGNDCFSIWMMVEDGVPESCIKLLTVGAAHASSIEPFGFLNNGQLIVMKDSIAPSELLLFDHRSRSFTKIGINGTRGSFFVNMYVKTLLLLDQPEGRVYPLVAPPAQRGRKRKMITGKSAGKQV